MQQVRFSQVVKQKMREGVISEMMRLAERILCLFFAIGIAACTATQTAKQPAEPTVEYFKLDSGKLKPGKVKANAYYEIEKQGRIYVFISPKAKEEFEKAGKTGKSPITGIGFGPNGETVIFESGFAQKEYENRHKDLLE